MMRRVILESPFAGDVEGNIDYARRCVRDSLLRGEAPIASHLLFTQPGILRDEDPVERQHGIAAGHSWLAVAEATVVYADRGITGGMQHGIDAATAAGVPVEYRSLMAAGRMTDTDDTANKPSAEAIVDDAIDAAAEWVSNLPTGQRAWNTREYGIAEAAARSVVAALHERLRAAGERE